MFDINIRVLKIISENKNITQREISSELGISLGKVNSIIKELERNNNLKIEFVGRKRIYFITEIGLKNISKDIKKLKDLRVSIHNDKIVKIKTAVILGAGKVEVLDRPSGFVEVDGKKVIDRMISILYGCGIEKLVIVSGYKSEYYEELAKYDNKIINIINDDYENTGSMISLAMCNKFIHEDFLLIENDLIFEELAIKSLINNINKDCVLVSGRTNKEKSVLVEIKNEKLFKLSKDNRDFNRIDGEFVGITKISKKFYSLMLKEMQCNENKLVNYEHIMLDISRDYNIGVEVIGNLKWLEVI